MNDFYELNNLPNVVRRYFYWIFNSKRFQDKVAELKPLVTLGKNSDELTCKLAELNTYYEIPKKYIAVINAYVLTGKFYGGIPVSIINHHYGDSITIQAPALVLVIKDKITRPQFVKMWEQIEKFQNDVVIYHEPLKDKEKEKEMRKFSGVFAGKKDDAYKQKPNFDRDFAWYKLHTTGDHQSYEKIANSEGRAIYKETVEEAIKIIKRTLKEVKREGDLI